MEPESEDIKAIVRISNGTGRRVGESGDIDTGALDGAESLRRV